MGYPVSDEKALPRLGGAVQSFEGGHVYWSPAGGAQAIRGDIAMRWASLGWENSWLGYPLTPQKTLSDGGLVQSFEGGHIYSSGTGGTQPVSISMASRWATLGWETGVLRYPTGIEKRLRDGGAVQSFEGGTLYRNPAGQTQPVRGGILTWWAGRGWENSSFGYPTTGEKGGLRASGSVQSFENGAVYWTPMYGPKGVSGPFLATWAGDGWENGRLGYPTAEAVSSGSAVRQAFEGGQLTLDTRTGKVAIAYR